MYIRDSKVNIPTGFYSLNEFNEQALCFNILTDVKKPVALNSGIDIDQNTSYAESNI